MNLWKVELSQLFRSWRGWTLAVMYFLASILAITIGILIDRTNGIATVAYDGVIDYYLICSVPAGILFIGLVVSALSFDSNKNLSIFLRLRFSIKRILITKLLVYVALSEILFISSFTFNFVLAYIFFDTSDAISIRWLLFGYLFNILSGVFYVCLIAFTSATFKSTVASILLTLAFVIGIPIFVGVATPIELAVRGIITETPPEKWSDVSYTLKVNDWWPTNISDTAAFYTVTESDIAQDKFVVNFEQVELKPWFRLKPLITSLILAPLLMISAWKTYTRREM